MGGGSWRSSEEEKGALHPCPNLKPALHMCKPRAMLESKVGERCTAKRQQLDLTIERKVVAETGSCLVPGDGVERVGALSQPGPGVLSHYPIPQNQARCQQLRLKPCGFLGDPHIRSVALPYRQAGRWSEVPPAGGFGRKGSCCVTSKRAVCGSPPCVIGICRRSRKG
uniref:Uncharacterized protein n=1 Tax=Sphaerodactylus townsendi TaxID=933632 RepID=A0ACB8FBM0_9SAUR